MTQEKLTDFYPDGISLSEEEEKHLETTFEIHQRYLKELSDTDLSNEKVVELALRMGLKSIFEVQGIDPYQCLLRTLNTVCVFLEEILAQGPTNSYVLNQNLTTNLKKVH